MKIYFSLTDKEHANSQTTKRSNERMNERTNEQTNYQTNYQTNDQTNEQSNKRTNDRESSDTWDAVASCCSLLVCLSGDFLENSVENWSLVNIRVGVDMIKRFPTLRVLLISHHMLYSIILEMCLIFCLLKMIIK